MKNKKNNKKRIIFLAILVILAILISLLIINNPKRNTNLKKVGKGEFSINITDDIVVDTTKTISDKPDAPKLRCRNDTN